MHLMTSTRAGSRCRRSMPTAGVAAGLCLVQVFILSAAGMPNVAVAQAPTTVTAQATTTSKSKTTTAPKRSNATTAPRHLKWQELVPKDWDPGQQVRDRLKGQNIDALSDTDPRVMEMMREMRAVWDAAPTNPAMDGVTGRLPGYVVPLDDTSQGMKEFLLVPYYGACIHSPPPPANQIVHVVSSRPVKDFQSMDTVWVHGTIKIERGDSYMGVSAYRIEAAKVERYVRNPAQNDGP